MSDYKTLTSELIEYKKSIALMEAKVEALKQKIASMAKFSEGDKVIYKGKLYKVYDVREPSIHRTEEQTYLVDAPKIYKDEWSTYYSASESELMEVGDNG